MWESRYSRHFVSLNRKNATVDWLSCRSKCTAFPTFREPDYEYRTIFARAYRITELHAFSALVPDHDVGHVTSRRPDLLTVAAAALGEETTE